MNPAARPTTPQPWLLLRALLLVLTLAAGSALAQPAAAPLRINTGVGAPYVLPGQQGFLDRLVREIFRRTGVTAEIARQPSAQRSLLNSNSGIDDGEALRVRGLEQEYPNLRRVDEKLIDNDFVAYTLLSPARLPTLEGGLPALRDFELAYIAGWKVFESRFGQAAEHRFALTTTQDAEQLFTLLERGRIDVVLFERWQGDALLRQRQLKARRLSPPIASSAMFIYLHKKHSHLLAPAAQALRAMKADGTYRQIARATLGVDQP